IFGPVLCALPFENEADLVAQANDTVYGLAAGIWTRDFPRGWRIARAIAAGTVWINTYKQLSISTPFGGFKESGLGREKGIGGMRLYQQTKSIYVCTRCEPKQEDTRMAAETTPLGFIRLGVMGETMCRNLVQKSGARVMAYDRDPAPLEPLREHGAQACGQLREAVEGSSIIFLSLPSGEVVREVALGDGGLLDCATRGQIIVDTSTSPVASTREL